MQNYVLLELYTDGTDSASERNQKFERDTFETVALPYYVIPDSDGQELAHANGLTRDAKQFVSFLQTGLGKRRNRKKAPVAWEGLTITRMRISIRQGL